MENANQKPQFVIAKEKPGAGLKPALLDIETHAVLKELSTQTGIPMVRLISKCVAFAMEHVVILDEKGEALGISGQK